MGLSAGATGSFQWSAHRKAPARGGEILFRGEKTGGKGREDRNFVGFAGKSRPYSAGKTGAFSRTETAEACCRRSAEEI